MHHTLIFALFFLGLHCGGGKGTTLPALGSVPAQSLCADVATCEVRGDKAIVTLDKAPIHLAEKQGPESYLGKVAPKRVATSVLKTCGGDVSRDDWLETGPSARTVKLGDSGKQQLRASLRTYLAQQLLAHPQALEGQHERVEAVIDAASMGLVPAEVSLLSQTYWLKDAAFERRVGQCGEEEYANIIYSLTLLQLSDLTRKELETKLLANLEAKLLVPKPAGDEVPAQEGEPSATPGQEEEGRRALLKELAFGTVQALANELRSIAAFGFDEQ